MSVALLYVILSEELVPGNCVPPFLHSYAGDRCGLNFAMQFSVTDAPGEAGRSTSSSLLTNRKGAWTGKVIHDNHRSLSLQCYSVVACIPTCTDFY